MTATSTQKTAIRIRDLAFAYNGTPILEDVTLVRGEQVTAHVRFKGGATRTLTVPLPRANWQMRQTDARVVQEIDSLLDEHTEGEIAGIYKTVARQVAIKIAAKAKDFSSKFPSIKISKET